MVIFNSYVKLPEGKWHESHLPDSQLISTTALPFHRCVGRRCHPDREVPDLALDTTKSPGLRHVDSWRKHGENTENVASKYNSCTICFKKISKSYYDKMEKKTAENHTSKTLNILHPVCFTTPRTLRFHLSLPSRPPRRKHSGRKWWWSPPAGPGMRITASGLIWFDWCWTCWTGDEIPWIHEYIWIHMNTIVQVNYTSRSSN